jgi:hypothetical protein
MDKNRFNRLVRPRVTEVRIGVQGIAFDRLELDRWWAHYKSRNGRPAAKEALWDAKEERDVIHARASSGVTVGIAGLSTKSGSDNAFTASLSRIARMRRKNS